MYGTLGEWDRKPHKTKQTKHHNTGKQNNHTRWRGRKEEKWSLGEWEESVKDTGRMG